MMDTGWKISQETWRVLTREAEQRWPNEACGLLLTRLDSERLHGDARWLEAICVENRAGKTRGSNWYEIDSRDWLRIERDADARGHQVVGVWHSHPTGDPSPSRVDAERAFPGLLYLILGMEKVPNSPSSACGGRVSIGESSSQNTRGRVTGQRAWVYHQGSESGSFVPVVCEVECFGNSR
jgi:proteasome lid subunit RPN8/RPN11